MAPKQVFLKAIPIFVAACFVGIAGSAFAAGGTTKAEQPKVDCKKYPENEACKGKSN